MAMLVEPWPLSSSLRHALACMHLLQQHWNEKSECSCECSRDVNLRKPTEQTILHNVRIERISVVLPTVEARGTSSICTAVRERDLCLGLLHGLKIRSVSDPSCSLLFSLSLSFFMLLTHPVHSYTHDKVLI